MSRQTFPWFFPLLLSLTGTALAAQQTVTILIVNSYSEGGNLTGASGSGSIVSVPCGEPVPADSNPPHREPGSAVPFCTYGSSGVMSFPFRFTQTNAVLTTEDGQRYSVVLYCQRQLSDCPKLADGEVYTGQMDKKAILDTSPSKPVFGPPKVALRPDGRHKVSYTIFSPRKLVLTVPHH